MNPSIRRFTLDTNATRSQISIPVTLNDTGRIWHITLTEGGICYAIEQGCLAVLTVKRPNGTYFEEFCPIAKNVTVIYDFRQNENTAAVEGIHDCEVTVYGITHEILTSATFTMVVGQRAVNSDDITITDDDRTVMDYMIGEEAKRQAAETERTEAEAIRASSENDRTSAEESRVAAEEERTSNYDRINNVTAEAFLKILKEQQDIIDIQNRLINDGIDQVKLAEIIALQESLIGGGSI